MSIPSDPLPRFEIIENLEGDEDGLVLITVKCVFAPQETRIIYVAFKTNHGIPDAAENKVSMWDLDDTMDRAAYREAMGELAQVHIFPLLEAVPHETLLWPAGGIATFAFSTTVDGSVQLAPGMLQSMKDVEARWLRSLPLIDTVSDYTPVVAVYDIDDVVVVDLVEGGSRDTMLAILRGQPSSRYVTSRVPAATGCVWSDYDHHAKAVFHEMAFLRTIPPHPHIMGPPVGYISCVHEGRKVLCGYLIKYYPGGSLGERERISAPIATRIKWAYQIVSGLRHLHHVAHTYHGDIKLDNVVLDENGDAILIDLEQGRMNEENAAPELRAASLVSVGDDSMLCYSTPRPGTDGAHARGGEDEGEVDLRLICKDRPYDIWKDTPRAIEAAEVWSFASALHPLLSDVATASAILARCMSENPNCRPRFGELEEFFLELYQRQHDSGAVPVMLVDRRI